MTLDCMEKVREAIVEVGKCDDAFPIHPRLLLARYEIKMTYLLRNLSAKTGMSLFWKFSHGRLVKCGPASRHRGTPQRANMASHSGGSVMLHRLTGMRMSDASRRHGQHERHD